MDNARRPCLWREKECWSAWQLFIRRGSRSEVSFDWTREAAHRGAGMIHKGAYVDELNMYGTYSGRQMDAPLAVPGPPKTPPPERTHPTRVLLPSCLRPPPLRPHMPPPLRPHLPPLRPHLPPLCPNPPPLYPHPPPLCPHLFPP
eukprot:1089205-Prorocentrum_minimum.AAC.1